MTDAKKPEPLSLADEADTADDAGYTTARKANAYYLCLLSNCSQMIRRQYAELETLAIYKNLADEYGLSIFKDLKDLTTEIENLREKLKTYEDLGDAADDMQLLRMGYAAARLEIESLRDEVKEYRHAAGAQKTLIETLLAEKPAGAQQVAAYAAPQFPDHPEPMVMDWSAIEISVIAQYGRDMYEAGKRASHGQAPASTKHDALPPLPSPDMRDVGTRPQDIQEFLMGYATEYARTALAAQQVAAQAAPAAVAGPSGYGPKVTVKRRCSDCKACNSESYAVQGDSGHYVYCEHPSLPERKYIGDTHWDTPDWCPAAAPTTQPAPQQEVQANTKTHDLLGTMIGLFLGAKDKIGYKPGSVVDKVVAEAIEHLKDWPYPEPAPQQVPILYDQKALLEVFQKAQAGSSSTAGTLRGIAAVIASWESRPDPHTWLIAAPQPSPAAQGDALDAARYRWLTADHHRQEDRARVYEIATSMNVRGKGHIDDAIDATRAAQEGKTHE